MATLKYTYSYREYPDAPTATLLDKHLQKGGFFSWFAGVLFGVLLAGAGYLLAMLCTLIGLSFLKPFFALFILFGFACFFIGGLFAPWLLRKLKVIDAIAKLEQKKNRKHA